MKATLTTDERAALRNLDAFADATDDDLERIVALSTECTLPAGRRLVLEGHFGRECFVIRDGTVRISRDGADVATLSPGAWLGEMALLDHTVRSATAETTERTTVIVFDSREFRTLLADAPGVADRVRQVAIERRVPASASRSSSARTSAPRIRRTVVAAR